MEVFNEGDVVQMKSGGAPMTVTAVHAVGLFNSKVQFGYVEVTSVSVGGLMQQFVVHRKAIRSYSGPMTPAGRYLI